MVIDDVGDASAFRLRPSADNNVNAAFFGLLIVLLPSSYSGGDLTFARGEMPQTVSACGMAVYAAALLSTTITSARITSGRHTALVYRLYHADVNGPTVLVPPAPDAAVAAFQALSRSMTEPFQRLGRALSASNEPLSFASLGKWNQAFICSTCRLGKVISLLPHPACEMPDAVVAAWIGQSPQAFLHMPPYKHLAYKRAIVLWSKPHRRRGLAQQRDDDSTYLSLASTHDLVFGTLPAFDVHGPAIVGSHSLPHDSATTVPLRFARHLPSMQRILMALNDVALATLYLRDVVTLQDQHVSVAEVAPVVYSLLTTFGWEPLLDAMFGLVQRWIKTHPDATVQLLISLAGLDTEAPVCRPLQQPFEAELFKRCYDAVLRTPQLFTDEFGVRRGPAVVQGLILLEHYVKTTVPPLEKASFLSRWLPPMVVAAVDAYLYAPLPVSGFLLSPDAFDPLEAVAVGLTTALRCQPAINLPLAVVDSLAEVLQSYIPHDVIFSDLDVVLAVFAVASHAHRLDAALFGTCAKLCGLALLPALTTMPEDSVPAVGDLVIAYIDASVHALANASLWPHARDIDKYPTTMASDAKTFGRETCVTLSGTGT
ncbi:hypothetical protein SDRG_17012 [Saprolegnia diclina VS20]|uniref:Uncharacterized protein n=1 Tax=Saprolegnia diclina (strain VS20) TaxID=1156394 RepID=T0QZB9_SAPDV|nr:hypothetical protein SDRG_17012 [Saprolegnia diclina VS20]EQC25098.1 hypothetical protein SDRG_17012 [Saprolegnia diclina VS20]|eukprot:XP_008621467.1 hypothetical protein SDRG_17012 [Saprolegnia diclina VS20]